MGQRISETSLRIAGRLASEYELCLAETEPSDAARVADCARALSMDFKGVLTAFNQCTERARAQYPEIARRADRIGANR